MSKMSSLTAFVGAAVAFTLSAVLPAPAPAGAAGVPSPVRPGAYRMPKVPGNLPLSSRFYAVDQGTSTVDSFSGTSYLMSITSSLNTPCCAIVGPYQFLHVLNLGTNQVTNYTPGTNTLNRVFGTGLQNPDRTQVIGIDGYVTIIRARPRVRYEQQHPRVSPHGRDGDAAGGHDNICESGPHGASYVCREQVGRAVRADAVRE